MADLKEDSSLFTTPKAEKEFLLLASTNLQNNKNNLQLTMLMVITTEDNSMLTHSFPTVKER